MQTDASSKGWGAHCNGISAGGKWAKKEQRHHINVLELIAVKFAIPTFTIHIQMDNKVALSYLLKMGAGVYTQSRVFKNQQVSLALSAVSWDHNYCRIFTNQIECPSRLGVSEFQGSLRLETASKHVSEHNQIFWISNGRPHPGCAINFHNM